MSIDLDSVFASIHYPMEQHPQEIRPFAEWLLNRSHYSIKGVLEIGVRRGGTAALWHALCSGAVIGVDYGGIDSLGEDETRLLADKMQDELDRYYFIYGDSHSENTRIRVMRDILHLCKDGKVDLLFLDGDHSYEGVKKDFEMYKGLVSSGGCIAFHDIVDTHLTRSAGQGVYRFWQELEGDKGGDKGDKIEFSIGAEWGGIGVLQV